MTKKNKDLPSTDNLLIKPVPDSSSVSGEYFAVSDKVTGAWYACEIGILMYISAGTLSVQTADAYLLFSENMTIYLPPKVPRSIKCMSEEAKGWLIYLPEDRTRLLPDAPGKLEATELLLRLCERIISWGSITEESKTDAQKRLSLTLIDELEHIKPSNEFDISLPTTKTLIAVAKKILENPDDRRTVGEWARFSGMSLRAFSQRFNDETGLPFSSWRQKVRLKNAISMLSQNYSVAAVASHLGYPSASAFVEIFKKQFGLPPKKYMATVLKKGPL